MTPATGFTIDSESTQDCDDAIWIEPDGSNVRLSVHIAAVAQQVPLGEYLDQQALQRGETRYLPHTIKPLFPQSLEAAMSLLPYVERPVVTVTMTLDADGALLDVQIHTGVLISQEKFSYEAVSGILAGAPHHLQPQLQRLAQVTQTLRRQREQQGAVYGRLFGDAYIDAEGRLVGKVGKAQPIIAELMILTNRVVSEYMHHRQLPWLYRTHDYRDLGGLEAKQQGLITALLAVEGEAAIRQVLAGYYDRAQYQATPGRHVGLGLDVYTHFTSPIRRYADLVNQRLLQAAITNRPMPYTQAQLETIAAHLTELQHAVKEQKRERLRALSKQRQTPLLTTAPQEQFESLSPSEFTKVLKVAVKQGQIERLVSYIRQRLQASSLQPMDCFQVLLVLPTDPHTLAFKLELLEGIGDQPLVLQVINLLINNWEPGTRVAYREQGEMNAWAVLCVVSSGETEQCPPEWSLARSKAVAKTLSSRQWLESFLYQELTTPALAQAPDEAIADAKAAASVPVTTAPQLLSVPAEDTTDYVTQLNLYAQQYAQPPATYEFEGGGTDWRCRCYFLELVGEGRGTNKKLAKSAAAKDVWSQL